MSGKVIICFQVANLLIMEETLKKLGHAYTSQKGGTFTIKRPYQNIVIAKNEISCDTMDQLMVANIKSEYQRAYQVHERTIRGEQFQLTETANEIVIVVQ
jgi:hypothetical protein